MNLARCNNGHYYDGDKFTHCPHCASRNLTAPKTVRMKENLDREETEQRKTAAGAGKALKDAVREAMEQKRIEENAAVHPSGASGQTVLPVGILVAMTGDQMGKIYPLWGDGNYIGYSAEGNLAVAKKKEQLSGQCAQLTYHAEENAFLLKELSKTSMIRLGGASLCDTVLLHPYDRIEIKEQEFLFVPICCEQFQWQPYLCEQCEV